MSKNIIRLSTTALALCFLGVIWSCSQQKSLIQDPRLMLDYTLTPNDSTLIHLSDDYRIKTINQTHLLSDDDRGCVFLLSEFQTQAAGSRGKTNESD